MDMRDGSPSIVRESCPQLQAARRVVMGWLRSCCVSAGLLDVSSLEVQCPRLLDFAFKAGLHRMKKIEMTR
jgi:hypothetical protein